MNACASASDLSWPALEGSRTGRGLGLATVLVGAAMLHVGASAPAEVAPKLEGVVPSVTSEPSRSPAETASVWIGAQRARDRAGYADLLSPDFSASTADGRLGPERWLQHRWPQVSTRLAYTAQVDAIHPAGIHWPDDPDAVEVELTERWEEGGRRYQGRARLTLVEGAVVDEAHWGRVRVEGISHDSMRSPASLTPSAAPKI